MRAAIQYLAGSVGVYLVVAACSSTSKTRVAEFEGEPTSIGDAGAPGAAGDRGSRDSASDSGGSDGSSSSDGGLVDAMVDAITDPVPDADAQQPESGNRLKARRFVGDDGSSEFAGWYDSEREEECSLQQAGEAWHCLPQLTMAETNGEYFDNECTRPILRLPSHLYGCDVAYAFSADAGSCSGLEAFTVYSIEATTMPETLYAGSSCSEVSAEAEAIGTDVFVGTVVPLSEFVSASVEVDS